MKKLSIGKVGFGHQPTRQIPNLAVKSLTHFIEHIKLGKPSIEFYEINSYYLANKYISDWYQWIDM